MPYSRGVDVDEVLLASPRGFCAGVEMAIKSLAWMVRVFEPPVYCYHEIVHNRVVVDRFRELGVIFVEDIAAVRAGAMVNAVCPLVKKVHHEVKVRAAKGYTVVYVGHAGHQEAIGTMAVAPAAVRLVERESDVDELGSIDGPVAL